MSADEIGGRELRRRRFTTDHPGPDLHALIVNPGRAMEVRRDCIAPTIAALTRAESRLATARIILATRLAVPVQHEAPEPTDELLDAGQAAACIGRSVSWLRRHGPTTLGKALRQPGGKGTAARWSRRELERWMTKGARP